MMLDERRKGTRCETAVTIGGTVSSETGKQAVVEKLTPALEELSGLEFFDKESGKIKIKPTKTSKPPKALTVDEKTAADFQKLITKPGS